MTSRNSPRGKNRYLRLTSATAQGKILTNDRLRKKSGKLIVGSWKQHLDGESRVNAPMARLRTAERIQQGMRTSELFRFGSA